VKVELKNIKEAGGEETPRFEATLYLDGKKAAIVSNGGTGGCNCYHWFDQILGKSEFGARFNAYAKEQNPVPAIMPDGKPATESFTRYFHTEVMDTEVFKMLDAAANAKKLKRLCGSKTLAHLPGETYKKGEWSVFKVKFSPEVKAQLEAKHPGIKFANEG